MRITQARRANSTGRVHFRDGDDFLVSSVMEVMKAPAKGDYDRDRNGFICKSVV